MYSWVRLGTATIVAAAALGALVACSGGGLSEERAEYLESLGPITYSDGEAEAISRYWAGLHRSAL
jgi:hypothetical protein